MTQRGEAAFPKLGILTVAPLTIAELQDSLLTLYQAYLRNPALQLNVLRRIVVNGEVENPDIYWVDVTATLRDAIAQAGGITEAGNRKNVSIVRNGERIKVKNWEQSQGPEADLRSGDQVIVGRKSWLAMNILPAATTAVVVTSFILSLRR